METDVHVQFVLSAHKSALICIVEACKCVPARTETGQSRTLCCTPWAAEVRENNAGGRIGTHMLSSQDGNRVNGAISPEG